MITEFAAVGAIILFLGFALVVDFKFNPFARSKEYRHARQRNWLCAGLLYAFFYMGRYNMSVVNNAEVRARLKASKSEYGLCLSFGHLSYAISMLCNGALVDRWGGKRTMIFGACGAVRS